MDSGSYSAAARVLGTSQHSVSQQMRRLEAWIGNPVFAREGATSKLTTDGEALLLFARDHSRACEPTSRAPQT